MYLGILVLSDSMVRGGSCRGSAAVADTLNTKP